MSLEDLDRIRRRIAQSELELFVAQVEVDQAPPTSAVPGLDALVCLRRAIAQRAFLLIQLAADSERKDAP
jgi:hypothetical protein